MGTKQPLGGETTRSLLIITAAGSSCLCSFPIRFAESYCLLAAFSSLASSEKRNAMAANIKLPVDGNYVHLPTASTETGSIKKPVICTEVPVQKEKPNVSEVSRAKSEINKEQPVIEEATAGTNRAPPIKLEVCEESPSDQEKIAATNKFPPTKLEIYEESPSDQEKTGVPGIPVISSVESHARYNEPWQDDDKSADKFVWRHREIQLLIHHYKNFKELFKSGSMKKKDVWHMIAKSMRSYGHNVTGEACDKKWRNLLSTYKGYIDHNRVTGCGRRNWQYFDQFHELYQKESTPLSSDQQARKKVNVGVQTAANFKQSSPTEFESACSFTTTLSSEVVMLPVSTSSSNAQSNISSQRKKSLETDEQSPLVEILKKKHKADAVWQLQVKELLFKNIKAQEETNEAINRLTEVLTRYIHER